MLFFSVKNGYILQDCLDGINPQPGDWHAAVKVLSVSTTMINRL